MIRHIDDVADIMDLLKGQHDLRWDVSITTESGEHITFENDKEAQDNLLMSIKEFNSALTKDANDLRVFSQIVRETDNHTIDLYIKCKLQEMNYGLLAENSGF